MRQGDPLSPYLFVLCMERLGHLIKPSVEAGLWKGIKVSRTGPCLSHLFFADDLVLFSEASQVQMREIRKCLEVFCRVSGQRVSLAKSEIFFSQTVEQDAASRIMQEAKMPITNNLGRYLGVLRYTDGSL